jgi:hypothetical protein
MWAVPIAADDSETYSLEIAQLGNGSQGNVFAAGSISAIYVPFGSSNLSTPLEPL